MAFRSLSLRFMRCYHIICFQRETDRLSLSEQPLAELISRKEAREEKADLIGAFMFGVMEQDNPITVFDDRLWLATIDVVKSYPDGRLVFKFQNGAEITA